MKTPLAWLNLRHDIARTFVAVAGVGFAALLIFIQLGFLGACIRSATLIFDRLDFDLAIGSPEYVDLMRGGTIPRARLTQVWELPGVRSVRPLSLYGSYSYTFLPSGQTLGLATNTTQLRPENAANYFDNATDPG